MNQMSQNYPKILIELKVKKKNNKKKKQSILHYFTHDQIVFYV